MTFRMTMLAHGHIQKAEYQLESANRRVHEHCATRRCFRSAHNSSALTMDQVRFSIRTVPNSVELDYPLETREP